jgi:NADPH2:quinone reductase
MKAIVCEQYGPPEDLVYKDVDSPEPGEGEVKIRLHARGVSYTDVLKVAGQYQVKDDPPFVPGGEAAGQVLALGAGVSGLSVGDNVLSSGGFAEETVQPVGNVIRLAAHVDLKAAAAFRSNYQTAYYGLQRGRLEAGETLLVHGAAGGVGLAAVDMGKLYGARVIATAGSEEKLAVCKKMGADHVINYSDGGFRDQVKDLTEGRGADVIYDPVGGDVFDESMRCVAPFGRILIVGFTGGRPALAKTNHLLIKDAEVIGYTIGGLARHHPGWLEKNTTILVDWLESGRIHPYYSHTLPLAQAADALNLIKQRQVMGKALLI